MATSAIPNKRLMVSLTELKKRQRNKLDLSM
jgi:hypothetical protein